MTVLLHMYSNRVPTVMENNLVMENGQKSHGNYCEKSWNFSTAYHESRTRSYDNSISVGLLQ